MKLYIGDTPEQLGSYQTADAIIVGDKVVTKADYLALVAQVETYKIALDTISSVVSGKTEFSLSEINSDYLNRILKASPSQCLREIQEQALQDLYKFGFTPEQYHLFKQSKDGLTLQAEAGRAGFVAGYNSGFADRGLNRSFSPEWHASHYAHDIRQRGE
jgi:hypothetical protein